MTIGKVKSRAEILNHLQDIHRNLETHITRAAQSCTDGGAVDPLLEDLDQLLACIADVRVGVIEEDLLDA